ncbi:Cof-type HAD-IIB family hydrolase [Facklamia sp. P13069]|uniref:Cof-type HAD-IIB family hydrolase n=1 Tax=Facklamia sp. P13069 TaxID=3421954 RepID=UPI003D17CA1D
MSQHMIAIDLDGTTLNNQSKLTPLTIQILQKLDHMGHLVCIVTGRPYRTSKEIYQVLNLVTPMVNFNGAYCHFPDRPEWLASYYHELDREIVFDLFNRQDELGIQLVCAEGKERLYTSSMNLPESPYYPAEDASYQKLSRQTLIHNPIAVTLFTSEADQIPIQKKIMASYPNQVSVRTWGGEIPVLEVVSKNLHKAVGVKTIADFYHIPRQNILAFGDEDNDLEMIEFAGHGVAMSNAIQPLKDIANDITEHSNDQDGLAHYLIDYFNLSFN